MSYTRKIEYRIELDKSFSIIQNCAGCGCKMRYINTGHFRVNANGKKLDVWLIYQCEKCKHTRNLSIYERKNPDKIPKADLQKFLNNDKNLALSYGCNFSFLMKNHVEIDRESISYYFLDNVGKQVTFEGQNFQSGDVIIIENTYALKIRPEKLASELLGISRSHVKQMLDKNQIIICQDTIDMKISINIDRIVNT